MSDEVKSTEEILSDVKGDLAYVEEEMEQMIDNQLGHILRSPDQFEEQKQLLEELRNDMENKFEKWVKEIKQIQENERKERLEQMKRTDKWIKMILELVQRQPTSINNQ